jgi:hypothetical protein
VPCPGGDAIGLTQPRIEVVICGAMGRSPGSRGRTPFRLGGDHDGDRTVLRFDAESRVVTHDDQFTGPAARIDLVELIL